MLNHKLRTFKAEKSFQNAIDYFNDTKKADMSLLKKIHDAKELDDDHYIQREGVSGAFDTFGDKSKRQLMDEYRRYKPTKIWTNFISIKREDAKELGLLGKKEYAKYTEKVVMYMAKELGITPSNLVWSGFYHIDTPAHDNVHFYLFDKSNPHTDKLLTKNQLYKIKSLAISDVLDRSPLLKKKEDAKNTLQNKVKEIIEKEEILTEVCWKSKLPIAYQKQFLQLTRELPTDGRLSYNSLHMKEYRAKLDDCIELVLNCEENKPLYINYLNQLDDVIDVNKNIYGKVDGSSHKEYRKDQLNRLYTVIGNAILKEIKSYRHLQVAITKDMSSEKKKEVNYINRRLKKRCVLNTLLTGKSELFRRNKKISTYYANRTRNDLLQAAQKEIQEKEYENEV